MDEDQHGVIPERCAFIVLADDEEIENDVPSVTNPNHVGKNKRRLNQRKKRALANATKQNALVTPTPSESTMLPSPGMPPLPPDSPCSPDAQQPAEQQLVHMSARNKPQPPYIVGHIPIVAPVMPPPMCPPLPPPMLYTPSPKTFYLTTEELDQARRIANSRLLFKTTKCQSYDPSTQRCPYGYRCLFWHPNDKLNPKPSWNDMQKMIARVANDMAFYKASSCKMCH